MRISKFILACAALLVAAPAIAQNAPSNVLRVQGPLPGYGDPLTVTETTAAGLPTIQTQGSTTAGQSGPLEQATVVSADTAYTVGTTNPLTLTATGRLRVGLSSAANLVPGTTTSTNADLAACTYRTPVTWTLGWAGGLQCDVSGNLMMVGNVANATTDSGNPVKTGCLARSTPQPAATNGQRQNDWCFLNGQRAVTIVDSLGVEAIITSGGADAVNNNIAGATSYSRLNVFNGTSWYRALGDASGSVAQPYAMTGSRWQYAAASGGIVNTTTAVTLAPAAGGALRNYVTGLQCTSASLGAATELAIRDGAAGTVIWRALVPSVGWGNGGATFSFNVPLKGTANTLVELVTLTAVTGGVYCNAQGYTAS